MIIRNAVMKDLKDIADVEAQCFPEAEAAEVLKNQNIQIWLKMLSFLDIDDNISI